MTPKDKAKNLFFEMLYHYNGDVKTQRQSIAKAKQCAIICVNEIISISNLANEGLNYKHYSNDNNGFKSFWNEVKNEIELL